MKKIVLVLDDDQKIRNGFRQIFEDRFTDLILVECKDYDEYEKFIGDSENLKNVRCFIMDLSILPNENNLKEFKSTYFINEQYDKNRVPIFIHSTYLERYDELHEKGSVYKIIKGKESSNQICGIIKNMNDSGFLEIFCHNGSLEIKIMQEIHKAFVGQFKPNEIENIINSVKIANSDNIKDRTIEIFERIALRAVYQNFINKPESSNKVNAVEHYYRRKLTPLPFYTGDIFKGITEQKLIFIATPRCNISNNNYDEILVCSINFIKEEQKNNFLNPKKDNNSVETKGHKSLKSNFTDDVTNPFIGERFRFLPPTPLFEGGYVDFKFIYTLNLDVFKSTYAYEISLADDLTNDVIRKMAAYLQRGGISDTDYLEAISYIK